jgi:hypothetical protein
MPSDSATTRPKGERRTRRKPGLFLSYEALFTRDLATPGFQLALETEEEGSAVKQSRLLRFYTELCNGPHVAWGPDDPFIQNWQVCIAILLICTTFVTAYEAAFFKDEVLRIYRLFFVNRFVDLGFLADMFVNFNMAYLDENNVLINSSAQCGLLVVGCWPKKPNFAFALKPPCADDFFGRYMVVVRWCLGVYKVRFNHKFVYNCCWSVSV